MRTVEFDKIVDALVYMGLIDGENVQEEISLIHSIDILHDKVVVHGYLHDGANQRYLSLSDELLMRDVDFQIVRETRKDDEDTQEPAEEPIDSIDDLF